MYRLLAPNGVFYLHLDWHANSYARILLDEIFGPNHLLNEIIWTYHGHHRSVEHLIVNTITILAYVKGSDYTFNADAVRQPYNPSTVLTFKASPKPDLVKSLNLERARCQKIGGISRW